MSELKSCPFCGGKAHLVDDYSSERNKTSYMVWHDCDGCEGRSNGYGHALNPWFETPWYADKETAIAAWNRRAERTATRISVPREGHTAIGHYECGDCRGVVGAQDAHCKHCGAKLVDS